MATREMTLAAVYSEGKTLQVHDSSAGTWLELPGLLDWTESGGERTGRTAGTDSTRPTGVVSNAQASTVECSFKYVAHPNWDLVDRAWLNKTQLNFRFETAGETIVGTATQTTGGSVSATGTLTIDSSDFGNFSADDFPLGADVKFGSNAYPILSVASPFAATAVKVKATAAVSTATFEVATPAERVSFSGKVLMCPTRQHNLAQQSEREGTLTIQCRGMLPAPVRIT